MSLRWLQGSNSRTLLKLLDFFTRIPSSNICFLPGCLLVSRSSRISFLGICFFNSFRLRAYHTNFRLKKLQKLRKLLFRFAMTNQSVLSCCTSCAEGVFRRCPSLPHQYHAGSVLLSCLMNLSQVIQVVIKRENISTAQLSKSASLRPHEALAQQTLPAGQCAEPPASSIFIHLTKQTKLIGRELIDFKASTKKQAKHLSSSQTIYSQCTVDVQRMLHCCTFRSCAANHPQLSLHPQTPKGL